MSSRIAYRHDVDGLRAVAVLAVFFFHLDFDFARGGFVGVDVFYVISGFVIFRSILDRPNYDVSFVWAFYTRRWRRILPALMATIFGCMVFGYILLTPSEYTGFARSSLATMFFVSNFYFKETLSYFADGVHSIPLLHTWSLGVEEQFYLLFPWVVVLVGRFRGQRGVLRVLIGATALSFAYNLYASYVLFDERHAFFLPMSRFWEIGVGTLVAVVEPRYLPARRVSALLSATGAVAMIASVTLIDSNMSFPGLAAVLPVGATALLILSRPHERSIHMAVMAAPVARLLGRISYSLYLLHWPAVIFLAMVLGRDLSTIEKLLVLAATTAGAYASWRLIEEPFRRRRARPGRALATTGLGALAVVALSLLIVVGHGMEGRLNAAALQVAAWHVAPVGAHAPTCKPHRGFPAMSRAGLCALADARKPVDYLLWGDSHAGMYARPLGRALHERGYNGVLAAMPDCPPLLGAHSSKRKNRKECRALGGAILGWLRTKRIPIVVLSSRWAIMGSKIRSPGDGTPPKIIYRDRDGKRLSLREAMASTVRALTATGAKVLIIGPTPEMNFDVPNAMTRALNLHLALPKMPRSTFDERQSLVMSALTNVAGMKNVSVVKVHEQLCSATECRFANDGVPLYRDDDHLSREGVAMLLPAILAAFEKLARGGIEVRR